MSLVSLRGIKDIKKIENRGTNQRIFFLFFKLNINERSALIEKEEQAYGTILSKDKKTTFINISIDAPKDDVEKEYAESMAHIFSFIDPLKEDYPEADIRYAGIVFVEYLSPLIIKAEMPILIPTLGTCMGCKSFRRPLNRK